jgi:hypothetical protein
MGCLMRALAMHTLVMRVIDCSLAFAAMMLVSPAWGAPLELVAKIPLGEVRGRIDHLAVDVARQRLFVAELGNDTVGVVDLAHRAVLRTLTGLHEPQGVGYEPITDTLYVANAGDGAVDVFQGADLSRVGRIELGRDADNVRIAPSTHKVIIGYGSGSLAIIDPASRKKVRDIKLKGHPESFQIMADGRRGFVNLPSSHQIAAVDFEQGRQTASWAPGLLLSNFPMSLDQTRGHVHVVFRDPATLVAFDAGSGKKLHSIETCADSDDVFFDSARSRAYVSCGEGFVEAFAVEIDHYAKEAKITTVGGARTALFVPELDRYFLAVRASGSEPAAIWIFKIGS